MSPVRQGRDSPAPTRRGWWAFPAGWFDWFYAFHTFDEVVPKRLVTGSGWSDRQVSRSPGRENARDREEWIESVGRRVVRRHRFSWSGPVWSPLAPSGKPAAHWHEREFVLHPSATDYLCALRRAVAKDVDPDHFEVWLCASDGTPRSSPHDRR